MDDRTIYTTFWTGHTGQKISSLSKETRILATYLMSAPDSNKIGLYFLDLPTVFQHTGLVVNEVLSAADNLRQADFAWCDFLAGSVWVHEMARYQYGDKLKKNDSRIGEIVLEFRNHINSKFARDFYRRYYQTHHLPKWDTLMPGDRSPENMPSQESAAKVIEKQVLEVLIHYGNYHARAKINTNSSSEEFRLIRDRLADGFTVGELCRAIDGNHLSPFHCGDNDRGKKYHSLELIFRNQSKTQEFIEIKDEADKPKPQKQGL